MKIYWSISFVCLVCVCSIVVAKKCCKKPSKQYYFTKTEVNNEEAHKLCARNGMRLASIQSEQEKIIYENGLRLNGILEDDNGFVWIAGKVDPERNSSHLWLWKSGDGLISKQLMNYTNWNYWNPDHKEDGKDQNLCVISSLKSVGWRWVNNNCDAIMYVACEMLY